MAISRRCKERLAFRASLVTLEISPRNSKCLATRWAASCTSSEGLLKSRVKSDSADGILSCLTTAKSKPLANPERAALRHESEFNKRLLAVKYRRRETSSAVFLAPTTAARSRRNSIFSSVGLKKKRRSFNINSSNRTDAPCGELKIAIRNH